ncbi:MAG: hypothetical protein JXA11_01465 [Phycisphaerae bacterium]|nr:hypothetical protein [Phycisphaerae bacterium]
MIDEKNWISVAEAAARLELSKRVVTRWIRTGRLASRLGPDGGRDVSLRAVETMREQLFDDSDDPTEFRFDETRCAADSTTAKETFREPSQEIPPSEPRDTVPPHAPRDPLSALENQAERSIQVAGAAFHEAKELAAAYRAELQTARQEYREEIQRVRRNGRLAWLSVAAAGLVLLAGVWFIGLQNGEQKLHEQRVSLLTDHLETTAMENQRLQTRMEGLKSESVGVAQELRTARLGQADAVGQLAAYRAHSEQLTQRVRVLEEQIRRERVDRRAAQQDAREQAARIERKRLAMIRQAKAEQAERARQKLAAQARAEQERLQRQQEQIIQAQRESEAQQRQAQQTADTHEALAQVDHRVQTYRRQNEAANLTLTELEQALIRKK